VVAVGKRFLLNKAKLALASETWRRRGKNEFLNLGENLALSMILPAAFLKNRPFSEYSVCKNAAFHAII
jgi:hypothetical protein